MRAVQIVGVGIRLFAIFIAIFVFRFAVAFFPQAGELSTGWLVATVAFTIVVPLFIAVYLWYFPLTVAGKLLPTLRAEESLPLLTTSEFQAVGFSLIGLWLLATTLPQIVYWSVFVYSSTQPESAGLVLSPSQIGSIWAAGLQFALSIFLLFGGKGLAGLVRRARYAGA